MNSDQQKNANGSLATFAWLATGIYLFATRPLSPGLLSWKAFLFLVVGMFAAAVVVGAVLYGVERIITGSFSKIAQKRGMTDGLVLVIKIIAWINFCISVAVAVGATIVCFDYMFG
jgi:hypothetical protein